MDCKHELKDLVGVADGVYCKKCGQMFDHIPKQEVEKEPEPTKIAEPVKKSGRKPAAKKGAK